MDDWRYGELYALEGRHRSDTTLAPASLGRLLELTSTGEARLIERVVRLPAGVSVGVVCVAR